ncbi:unnamed protein product [Closterium sp. NIES-64]|nr:unnamed protein product [Closterium sp. NIES-64]CAI6009809.1 unnamed protein product [Closterium sp. NIES-65]
MPVTLKVAGSWSGQVEIPSLTEWTVCELRAELSRLSGIDAGSLKIICGGRTLKDQAEAEGERGRAGEAVMGAEERVAEGDKGDVGKGNNEGNGEGDKGEGKGTGNSLGKRKGGRGRSLEEVGVRAGSRLLVTGGGRRLGGEIAAEGKRVVEEEAARKEREERLSRVRAAAGAIARRGRAGRGGRGGREMGGPDDGGDDDDDDDAELLLENQSGQKLEMAPIDKRSLVSGLLLHSHGRTLLSKGNFVEALPVLEMAEEAFSICDAKITEAIDNIPMLLLDIVWCHYMMKDVASLASAKGRLAAARSALRKAHGADMSRLRMLQGNFRPELATYLRLDLLDAIAAYHSGDLMGARPLLASAQSLFQQLQVSDDSLASLAGMGFLANEARRALRVAGGDVSRAAEFVILQRQREAEKAEEDRRQRRMEREQRAYGRTPRGKKVDMRLLDELAAYGFTRRVAAEALRQSENHHQRALDALLDPTSLAALEVAVADGKADGSRRRHSRGGGSAAAGGMSSDDSVAALVALGFSAHQARQALEGSSNDVEAAAAALLQGEYGEAGIGEGGGSGEGGSGDGGNGTGGEGTEGGGGEGGMDVEEGEGSEGGSEGSEEEEGERDEEMEGEIRKGVSGDPYAEYDLDVSLEAAAIEEYSKLIIGTSENV